MPHGPAVHWRMPRAVVAANSHLCDAKLQDDDPYVRKTAAICVAKLFDINAELVHDRGFLDALLVRFRCAFLASECPRQLLVASQLLKHHPDAGPRRLRVCLL